MPIDFPVTISLFGKEIWIHPILETIGIFIGMRYYFFLKKKKPGNLKGTKSIGVLIGAMAGAFFGSKIIGNLENLPLLFQAENPFVFFWSNNTIVGGLAFGLIGVEIAKKIVGHKESTGDLIVFPLMIAMIIGRIGCFLTGVYEPTFGLPTNSVFGMDLGDGIPRHPVALYEIIFLISLFIILKFIQKNKTYKSGFLFQIFMLTYFGFRFLTEFIKPRYEIIFGLGTLQLVCILVILYYIYLNLNQLYAVICRRRT